MKQFKEGAEIVEGRMTFIQRFLQKKYGPEILFFVLVLGGFITAIAFFNKGVESGAKNVKEEIISLKNSKRNDSIEIRTLNARVYFYKKSLDSCNTGSMNSNLESLLTKKLEEAERIKKLVERKISNDQKDIKALDKIIKN